MPNHVTTFVELQGAPEEKKKFFETYFSKDDEGKEYFDFNKVIPEPEGMGIELDLEVEDMIKNTMQLPVDSNPLLGLLQAANRAGTPGPDTLDEEKYKMFLQGLDNYRKHGHIYWYDWRIAKWGTKWNSYDNQRLGDTAFQFDTAWSHPEPVLIELSKQMPSLVFNAKYADEDTGSNVGRARYEAGTSNRQKLRNGSKAAYELAFELHPDKRKYYRWDEGKHQYVYVDGDEEEEV